MQPNTPPCGQGCQERKVGCHGSCERYLKWAEGKKEENWKKKWEGNAWTQAKGNVTTNSTSHTNDSYGWGV